ncbi:hypothetical protein H0E87_022707 [Populus deltoides]|uniref:Uncharacterized protein n=1 Tax=Populus deltoides TaxID=3696 RepID=A0A8T2X9L6_POPDE|nr:hypothetical protein H0E87_022707 [Populus deltoides]
MSWLSTPTIATEFGCLMYTGDFQWEVDSKRAKDARSRLLNVLKNETVDVLYLDNTYCNPSYDFPTREVATQQVVDIIASHPERDIVIGIDTLGKEELLIHISRVLNIKVQSSLMLMENSNLLYPWIRKEVFL